MKFLRNQLRLLQDLVTACRAIPSLNARVLAVKQCQELRDVLLQIHDDRRSHGITSHTIVHGNSAESAPDTLEELLGVLEGGSEAQIKRKAVQGTLSAHPQYSSLIMDIVDKNLKCRLGYRTILRAFDDEQSFRYDCPLAYDWCDEPSRRALAVHADWLYSRKLDGVRCITHLFAHSIELYSRRQRSFQRLLPLIESNLGELRRQLQAPPGDYVLDGELCVLDAADREDFRAANALVHTHHSPHSVLEEKTLFYYVFDCLHKDEVAGRLGAPNFSTRLQRIPTIAGSRVLPLAHFPLSPTATNSHDQEAESISAIGEQQETNVDDNGNRRMEAVSDILNERCRMYGHEGLMLRCDAPGYFPGRTRMLLKAKLWADGEFRIIGITPSTMRLFIGGIEREVTACGSLDIELPTGSTCSVGSGLSAEERLAFLRMPPIGQLATIKYQSFDDGNMRFPVFKGLRPHSD